MSAWPEVRLGDVARITDGDWIETKDQGGSDYRLLQVSNIGKGSFRETGKYRYITSETFERLRCTEVIPGMVLVARMPDPVGRAWHVESLDHRAITAVDVAIVKPNSKKLDPRFCSYALNAPAQLVEWATVAGGTTRSRITRRQLADARIRLPSIEVQRRVSDILGKMDKLVENNRRRVELLEQIAREIYREWFVHLRYPGHEDGKLVDSSLGPIPSDWSIASLGDAGKWLSGGTPSTANPTYWDGDIPWITSGSLTSILLDRSDRRVTPAGLTNGTRLVPRDALVFVVRGMSLVREFRVGLADVPLAFGQDCKAIVARPGLEPLYLGFTLIAMADQIQSMVELAGHGTGKLSTDRLKAIEIFEPSERVQRAFANTVEPVRSMMSALRDSTDRLVEARDLLLPKLLSGRIDASKLDLDAV